MLALLKKEYLEIIRSKKLLILAIILLFIAVSSPIIAKLIPTLFQNLDMQGIKLEIPEASWRDAIDQYIKNLSQIAMIVFVFMFAGSVAEEKNKKTLEILLTKPVPRSRYILCKFIAALASVLVVYVVAAIIFYIYSVNIFGHFSLANFAIMAVIMLLYLWQAISLTIFCSTFANNQIIAAGVAFFIEIVLVTILGSIEKISKYLPGYILANYRDLMDGAGVKNFVPSIIVSIILILMFVALSMLVFKKQEIER